MPSVLIPQQAQAPTEKKRSGFSQIFEQVAPMAAGAAAGYFSGGNPAAIAAGQQFGQRFGGQIGDAITPPKTTGGNMETLGYKPGPESNALSRRADMQVKDPVSTLQEAKAALAVRSPDEQKEYGPVINQAILEARRQKGVMA